MPTYSLDPIKVKDHACAFSVKGLSDVVKTWWSHENKQKSRNEDHYEKIIEEILEISEDELYGLDDEVPGTKQHNLNWEKIWPTITFKYINVHERDVIFKLMYGILPTKLRL